MTQTSRLALALLFLAAAVTANAQTRDGISRGELLYTTHCIACHSTQVHWRNRKVVKNWPGLQAEVGRWQKAPARFPRSDTRRNTRGIPRAARRQKNVARLAQADLYRR